VKPCRLDAIEASIRRAVAQKSNPIGENAKA
jgi:hypothetical protein